MIILLYGQDAFRSRLKLEEIIESHQQARPSGLNLFFIDFDEEGFEVFRDGLQTRSIFAEKKLFVLKNALKNEEVGEKIAKFLKNQDEIIVFIENDKIKVGNRLFAFLKKTAKVQEFKLLSGREMVLWLEKWAALKGIKIDALAIRKLADFWGSDLWIITREIEKLYLLKASAAIDSRDIDLAVGASIEANIFKTIEAIALGNKKSALKMISHHLESGESPFYLLAMIAYQFRNLILVKNLVNKNKALEGIIRETGLSRFVAEKCLGLSRRFTLEALKNIYFRIFETDSKIKTGKISPRQGIELLVISI